MRGIDNTGQPASDTTVILKQGQENIVPINSCIVGPEIFADYSIDGVQNIIIGDSSTPNSPPMNGLYNASPWSPMTMINCMTSPVTPHKGFSFEGGFNQPGTFTGSSMPFSSNWVFLDGVQYSLAPGAPLQVTITRYDQKGGFIIGSVDLQVTVPSGGTKRLVGNFKVKRIL